MHLVATTESNPAKGNGWQNTVRANGGTRERTLREIKKRKNIKKPLLVKAFLRDRVHTSRRGKAAQRSGMTV